MTTKPIVDLSLDPQLPPDWNITGTGAKHDRQGKVTFGWSPGYLFANERPVLYVHSTCPDRPVNWDWFRKGLRAYPWPMNATAKDYLLVNPGLLPDDVEMLLFLGTIACDSDGKQHISFIRRCDSDCFEDGWMSLEGFFEPTWQVAVSDAFRK